MFVIKKDFAEVLIHLLECLNYIDSPAPAAPAQAPTPSATLSQLPLPPQLALQLQRHKIGRAHV